MDTPPKAIAVVSKGSDSPGEHEVKPNDPPQSCAKDEPLPRPLDSSSPNAQVHHFFLLGARAIAVGRRPPAMLTGVEWLAYCKVPRPEDVIAREPPATGFVTEEQSKALREAAVKYANDLAESEILLFPPPAIAPLFAWHPETTWRVYYWLRKGASDISGQCGASPMMDDSAWAIAQKLPRGCHEGVQLTVDERLVQEKLSSMPVVINPTILEADLDVLDTADEYAYALSGATPDVLLFPPPEISRFYTFPAPRA